jgi:hypothetical protein
MALLRKKEIIHNSNRAQTDLAWSRKERVTWVSLPLRLNSQVSSMPVANLDSGAGQRAKSRPLSRVGIS